MSKTLTLKPRDERGGTPTWHDSFVLQNALNHIATGKPITKAGLWMNIAAKVQYAQEENELGPQNLGMDVQIELRNVEARKLCEELKKLKPEQYGFDQIGQPKSPALAPLYAMLSDFGSELGHTIISTEEDEE